MAEFKLICPGCSAEYALPQDAIPPSGREVECSSCGHVWQAHPPAPGGPLDLGGFSRSRPAPDTSVDDENDADDDRPARPLPPASARLPADVLGILRDEVEHERRLRDAEHQDDVRASTDEIDWPATTVTLPAASSPARPPRQGPTVIRYSPARERSAPSGLTPVIPVAPPRPMPAAPASDPVATATVQTAAPAVRKVGFGWGFGLALLAAGCVAAVYLLAPMLAPRGGPLADLLMTWREGLDNLRLWLAARLQNI